MADPALASCLIDTPAPAYTNTLLGCRLVADGSTNPHDYCLTDEERTVFGLPLAPLPLAKPSHLVGLDCEMVRGVTDDLRFLARLSLVHEDGTVLFDTWVKPTLPVGDYKPHITGATPHLLASAPYTLDSLPPPTTFVDPTSVILCGHGLITDFYFLPPAWRAWPFLIDTSILCPHPNGPPSFRSLAALSSEVLHKSVRTGGEVHSSINDALAACRIVRTRVELGYGYQRVYRIPPDTKALFDDASPPTLEFLMEFLKTNGFCSIKALYLVGSRGVGTAAAKRPGTNMPSDWDFIGVYERDGVYEGDGSSFCRYGNIDIALYSLPVFRKHLADFEPGWHEAIYGEVWYEDASCPNFRKEVSDLLTANPYESKVVIGQAVQAALTKKMYASKRAFREDNVHRGKSLFFVGLRFLAFGIDLATKGCIESVRCMNDLWFTLRDDTEIVSWPTLWSKDKPFKHTLLSMQKALKDVTGEVVGSSVRQSTGKDLPSKKKHVLGADHPMKAYDVLDSLDQSKGLFDFLRDQTELYSFDVVLDWLACGPLKLTTRSLSCTTATDDALVSLRYSPSSPKCAWTSICRGVVVDPVADWCIVARPFDRFFPLTPSISSTPFILSTPSSKSSPVIDWSSTLVTTKEDGSLAILYHYKGLWRVASASTPDANFPLASKTRTFAEEFWLVWKEVEGYPDPATLDPSFTYMFEFVTPEHVIIVRPSKPSLSLLGVRHTKDGTDLMIHGSSKFMGLRPVAHVPFPLFSSADESKDDDPFVLMEKKAKALDGRFHEGWVLVCPQPDGTIFRAKVKAPDYTRIAWLCPQFWHEELMTPKRLFQVLLEDEVDTFRSHCPHFAPRLDQLLVRFEKVTQDLQEAWTLHGPKPMRDYAVAIQALRQKYRAPLFMKRKHPQESWLTLARLNPKLFLRLLDFK